MVSRSQLVKIAQVAKVKNYSRLSKDQLLEQLEQRIWSLENPRTPLTIPDERPSASGVAVSENSIVTYPAVWRALSLISGDIAKCSLVTYRNTKGGKVPDLNHPVYRLLRWKPNKFYNAFNWQRTAQWQALMWGNSYTYITRDNRGRPVELLLLTPSVTSVHRVDEQVYYKTIVRSEDGSSEEIKIMPEDMIHIRGIGPELQGWNLLEKARESCGLGLALQKYSNTVFRNAVIPSMLLKHPATLTETAKDMLRRQFERMHAGLDSHHRIAVLSEGMQMEPLTFKPQDAQVLETRMLEVKMVALWFSLPPSKLGAKDSTSYNSLESEDQAYLSECIQPWAETWAYELRDKLLTEEEKNSESHVIQFDLTDLVKANIQARADYYTKLFNLGSINSNEIRNREGFNAVPEGNKYYMTANVKPVETDEEDTEDVQAMALNGTQITSLLAITDRVVSGQINHDAAKALIAASFPLLSQKQINSIVDSLEKSSDENLASDTTLGNGQNNKSSEVFPKVLPDKQGGDK